MKPMKLHRSWDKKRVTVKYHAGDASFQATYLMRPDGNLGGPFLERSGGSGFDEAEGWEIAHREKARRCAEIMALLKSA